MKKTDIPQDKSALENFTKEVCYAVDESGNYSKNLSSGWDIKSSALTTAWNDIEGRIAQAKQQVLDGKASPIPYFMELKLMDLTILSAYTGFFKWTIKRHFNPSVFNNLSEKKLKIYANAFNITVNDLKNINGNES